MIAIGCLGVMLTATSILGQNKDDSVAKGKETFKRCVVCHDPDSANTDQPDNGPDELAAGPGLKGLFKREKLKNGKDVTEENVAEVIKNGGKGMPAWGEILSDEERSNVLAYLKTL